ncbi:hypothetical protein [Actinomadura macra]|uniref:hypothetical protein n=1 Tax=Actinomadura macra TaxID=46164 RepID=UPI0008319181|nr:hypothetical protein [Actinomadura macra]
MSRTYEVIGDTEMIIIVDGTTREVVGAAYAEKDSRWWLGILHGRVRRLYVLAHTRSAPKRRTASSALDPLAPG